MSQDILKQLRETEFFSKLSDDALAAVVAQATVRTFAPDEAMIRKGDSADSFFVVLSGNLKIVTTDGKGDEIIINKVEPGETVGEMSLIDQRPRSAGVIALEDVRALELNRDVFFDLLTRRADVAIGILQGYSSRLRFSTTYIEKVIDWSQKTAEGDYSFLDQSQPLMTHTGSDDDKAAQLLSTFYSMVKQVKAREEGLKQELERLTFEIDQTRRRKEFEEITGTEFYANLKEQAKALRQKRAQQD
ncbi:MAG: cyclic nucleotide-binding domain-containing protein [Anaerolineales bacterium]|nr:cyclic nucleotide-binding domain-containing protein [Anaerolineales bacterium]